MWVRLLLVIACTALSAQARADGPCVPGEPAVLRIDARPRRLSAGERFCFETRVDDAAGCPVPNPRVRFRVDPEIAGAVGMLGRCFVAPAPADGAAQEYRIVAQAGAARRSVVVRVDPLGFEPVQAPARANPIGERPAATFVHATSAVAEDARAPLPLMLALFVLIAASTTMLGVLWYMRRSARSPRSRPVPAHDVALSRGPSPRPSPLALSCPRCGVTYSGVVAYCSVDGARLH
ncbi:MAG: hypothetical protein H5U40_00860 [Polyangiaceae bacterium]|nr:hypothetical protein [Polyangiaceae bacterium]